MASPYLGWENSIIYFPTQIVTGQLDDFGNPIIESIEVSAKAYLRESASANRAQIEAGLDRSRIYLVGRLVDPMVYPAGIIFPRDCRAVVQGTEGKIELMAPVKIGIAQPLIQSIAGASVSGWFEVVTQNPLVSTL